MSCMVKVDLPDVMVSVDPSSKRISDPVSVWSAATCSNAIRSRISGLVPRTYVTDVEWWRDLNLPLRSIIQRNGRIVMDTPDWIEDEEGKRTQANKWTNMGFSLISNMINGVSQPVLVETSSDAMRQKNIFRMQVHFIPMFVNIVKRDTVNFPILQLYH